MGASPFNRRRNLLDGALIALLVVLLQVTLPQLLVFSSTLSDTQPVPVCHAIPELANEASLPDPGTPCPLCQLHQLAQQALTAALPSLLAPHWTLHNRYDFAAIALPSQAAYRLYRSRAPPHRHDCA